ncbi:hypothetical protein CFOL_v3_09597 [Cephalotus follicularis]|uniref:WD40 domain-containing protein n=1 Tax=Cephalotus follicularis TaxID=3775 RepID=A0A1Q3BDH9_CEPFO|nr:hypothetical protein CFOL_v3_09597 [Cephalotus follicularis]
MEEEESLRSNNHGVRVSIFDYSIENHFKAMDTISKLCEEPDSRDIVESEIQRISSSVTFLREWSYFKYEERIVSFVSDTGCPPGTDSASVINLPQFSSSTVPKDEGLSDVDTTSPEFSNDFVMYVGGSIWALDWCPIVHAKPDCLPKCEFIAVSAHPPDAYYHKIGAPLTGRGIVQIWCILNVSVNKEEEPPSNKTPKWRHHTAEEDKSTQLKRPRGRPRKTPVSTQPRRPRGRPRKKPIDESPDILESNSQFVQPLCVQYPEDSSELLAIEGVPQKAEEQGVPKTYCKKLENTEKASTSYSEPSTYVQSRLKGRVRAKSSVDLCLPSLTQKEYQGLTQNEDKGSPVTNDQIHDSSGNDSAVNSILVRSASCTIPKGVALPRVVFCLAHNGKVAWDVKWQPSNVYESTYKQRMGYLAVLLGNGSLEVWEVPLPRTMEVIYSSSIPEGTDPRFVKLQPVFRCSMLKCGDFQSIPLTLEWSSSPPHDYLLAGCHDGTVALWKFSISNSSKDTRPLLRFTADSLPIRAVAWAPVESDLERANVILTAGHGGLKFWDIRDPFRPLWELHPVPRFIYSLDWLPDPRCVILSFDDGTMRILSLVNAAYDTPVTGKAFTGTKQQGLHLYNCSSFAIWSVQVSRLTGMVAYCSADGTVLHFQLTTRAVEKDPSRNRAPHFMCGALSAEESAVTVKTPLPHTPVALKKSINGCGDSSRSMRSLLYEANRAKTRANDKKANAPSSDNQTLALCYGDDPGIEFESEETLAALKRKKNSKSKSSSKKKTKNDQPLVCIPEESTNLKGKENERGETETETEKFPPKIVAMHRVRWNMNKGSERWLCYGGAAGILRCQEIRVPDVCKKPANKGKQQL